MSLTEHGSVGKIHLITRLVQLLHAFENMFHSLHGRRQLPEPMKKQWLCVSCLGQIELDTHGRCSTCGSDAVDRIERGAFVMNQQAHPPTHSSYNSLKRYFRLSRVFSGMTASLFQTP